MALLGLVPPSGLVPSTCGRVRLLVLEALLLSAILSSFLKSLAVDQGRGKLPRRTVLENLPSRYWIFPPRPLLPSLLRVHTRACRHANVLYNTSAESAYPIRIYAVDRILCPANTFPNSRRSKFRAIAKFRG